MKAIGGLSLEFDEKPSLLIMATVMHTSRYFLHLLFTYVYLKMHCIGK